MAVMKENLLALTQGILSDINGEEVNSIDDTVEAAQVAQIIIDTYFDIISLREYPEHRELIKLTDPDIHEPKGVSGASSGQVYVADGAGSGDWTASQAQGWGRYDDSAGTQVFGTSYSKFTIDGLGADSNSSYLPLEIRGSAELWDPVDDVITPIALGDSYLIRFHFDVTGVTGTPTLFFPVLDDSGGG